MAFENLTGRRVSGVSMDLRRECLSFETDEGPIAFFAEGDCCSRSWFEHMENVGALIGGVVRETVEIDLEDLGWDGGELTRCYGFDLKTDKGTCRVELRNESNGYYGGSVERAYHDPKRETLRPVEADF